MTGTGSDLFPRVPFAAADVDRAAYTALRPHCRRLAFLPVFRHGVVLDAAMVLPGDESALAGIRQLTHQEVRRFGISREDFEAAVAALDDPFGEGEPAAGEGAAANRAAFRPESWECHRRTPREITLEMIRFAFAAGASDLLLDEQEGWMDVAIKICGAKEILPPVERAFASLVLKAFKEISGLSTHTVLTGQSGFASVPVGPVLRADLRVEVTPTIHGESLVARIQDRQLQLERMERLPFTDRSQIATVQSCLRQQQGLLIVTGPTGHGKTTTLYSCLGQLDRSVLNIRTLEDPVEFAVPWITQIPVGAGTGRTFADGLKSLLRQAPHVILMGEIRDRAVAQTCIEAADTGHLILATLHTRDAVGVIARLIDLGLSGGQIAGALNLAIGQRLLRRLCPACRAPRPLTRPEEHHFARNGLPVPARLWTARGCPDCGGRGESGMTAVFEFFHPAGHDRLEEMIGRAARETYSERRLRALWLELGGSSLVREGLRLAANGEVSHAEVLKYERCPLE